MGREIRWKRSGGWMGKEERERELGPTGGVVDRQTKIVMRND